MKLVFKTSGKDSLVADDQELSQEEGCFIDRQRIDRDFSDYQRNLAEGEYVQINWDDQVIGILDRHNRAEIVERMVAFLITQGHFDPSVS